VAAACFPLPTFPALPSPLPPSPSLLPGVDGKPAVDPKAEQSPNDVTPEILTEPPEESVPERRDAPPLPMAPLVDTDNVFHQPPKRIFVQNTRSLPPLPSLPSINTQGAPQFAAPYPTASVARGREKDAQYNHKHNTHGWFRLKDPLVLGDPDSNEEEETKNLKENPSALNPSEERERARDLHRYEEEKKLLRASAKLEQEHEEILVSQHGNKEKAEEVAEEVELDGGVMENEEEEEEEENGAGSEGASKKREEKKKKEKLEEQEMGDQSASLVVKELHDNERLNDIATLKVNNDKTVGFLRR